MQQTPSIVDLVTSQLGPEGIQTLGDRFGLDPATTQRTIAAAVPLLTGGLSRNAAQPQGAAALHQAVTRDHDGSILDNLGGFLSQGDTGLGGAIDAGRSETSRHPAASNCAGRRSSNFSPDNPTVKLRHNVSSTSPR
jgi:hypothetical protein